MRNLSPRGGFFSLYGLNFRYFGTAAELRLYFIGIFEDG